MFSSCYSETNQERIVEAGGLTSLLMLLENSEDETIHRVAAGAIANLAMNGINLKSTFIITILAEKVATL